MQNIIREMEYQRRQNRHMYLYYSIKIYFTKNVNYNIYNYGKKYFVVKNVSVITHQRKLSPLSSFVDKQRNKERMKSVFNQWNNQVLDGHRAREFSHLDKKVKIFF